MSTKQANWDGLTGLFSILFGLTYGGYAYNMPQPMFGNPLEAIFLPLAISAISIFIGVLLIIKGGITPSIMAVKALLNESPQRKSDRRKIAITCIICFLYALTFEHLGYVISTFFFMFAMLMVTCGSAYWKKGAMIAIIFAGGIFFTFNNLLSVNLPPFPFFN
ncbi:tripartite tricarboxylate transporter TctB family protein [Vibrio rumoiensis]|uniref:Tricarboxylate transporter n=1 Tax=Vibrio rumoiensis 1S-45 TaxID=1188252 RepID=A0A1E5DZZ9_9VIBR|nr:tripartite tricarboxylate transporter TctB family protein [Vibrio rumoiensis]OEF23610.1 tricarboxylate transporter [Vibrio rumoiensis 1S-45]